MLNELLDELLDELKFWKSKYFLNDLYRGCYKGFKVCSFLLDRQEVTGSIPVRPTP